MAQQPSNKQVAQDLCLAVIKMAKRVQALPLGKTYQLVLTKHKDGHWDLALLGGGKVEYLV